MKFKLLISILIIFCFLVGCSDSSDISSASSDDDTKIESSDTPFKEPITSENNTEPNKEVPMINLSPIVTDPYNTLPKDNLIKFLEGGIARITYDYNRSQSKVLSNIQDLSPYNKINGLAKYDEEYFNTSSLLLIIQTTNSGSIGVSVEAIGAIDKVLKIKLEYTVPEIGTADMATWLIWVELDKDYDEFIGEIINPATKPGLSAY